MLSFLENSTSEVLGGKTFFLLHEHLAVHLNDYFTGLYTTTTQKAAAGCNFGLEKFINYFLPL